MNDIIGCRLEARTSVLFFDGDDTFVLDTNETGWWQMTAMDNGIRVNYTDSPASLRTGDLTYEYSCFVRRSCRDPGSESEVEVEWQPRKRIFHLPRRPDWKKVDRVIAGVAENINMRAALPYPVAKGEDESNDCEFASAIKQHLYLFVPRGEFEMSHRAHLACALDLLEAKTGIRGIETGQCPFMVLQGQSVPDGPEWSHERRTFALEKFQAFATALDELCFGNDKRTKRSLDISLTRDDKTFMLGRSNRTLYVKGMTTTTSFLHSRDWADIYYDSHYCPPKPFVMACQWLVCTSMHLVNFTSKLSKLADEHGLSAWRIPIASVFSQPAPTCIWSNNRETDFDRLLFYSPYVIEIPREIGENARKVLNARLLHAWLRPPLNFMFIFCADSDGFKAQPIKPEPGEDVPNVYQRFKGWCLWQKDGMSVVTLCEHGIYWLDNHRLGLDTSRLSAGDVHARNSERRELFCIFLRLTKSILAETLRPATVTRSEDC